MKIINIQSVSDLITNSSTEVFIVYDESNINSIKKLVNSILSLIDSSKTFDDYFNIEMLINYDQLDYIFDRYSDAKECYDAIPEFKVYSELSSVETQEYIKSIPLDRLHEIIDFVNRDSWGDEYCLYKGFSITAKSDDPVVKEVASVINDIDDIFTLDYSDNY